MAKVAITHHANIERGIEQALDHLEIEELVHGKIVAVKPNDTWASEDDKTGVTQPDTLRADAWEQITDSLYGQRLPFDHP